ncbi:hypothetical protein [Streptomyces sp. NPDC000395]|uniref:hypothetical protein n=1 Tax=Streptomyces sp. NPDC000395 TaxID=3154252 RepID=UPI00336A0D13
MRRETGGLGRARRVEDRDRDPGARGTPDGVRDRVDAAGPDVRGPEPELDILIRAREMDHGNHG